MRSPVKSTRASIPVRPIEPRAPARLSGALQFDMVARSGSAYRIFVYVPPVPPPARGFPVFYVLDGNAMFATAMESVALQMRRPDVTGVPASVVVGIGYPTETTLDPARRSFDYAPPAATAATAGGGADLFVDFLQNEVKPAIEAMSPVDPRRQALFGHSLGGLFVLWTLFNRPDSFRSYSAASPSIWWSDRAVLASEAKFAGALKTLREPVRLLLTAGSLEASSPAARGDAHARRMADEASSLANRLTAQGSDRLDVQFVEFADENHASVVPAAISRSVRFASQPD